MKQCYTLFFLLCCFNTSIAQSDSSWLDLGRIKLKKDFTQSITIKAKDLEQMPFSTLDEALNVWLYGLGTNPATMTYVVDGTLLMDVHAYSIHDIEEITLVQNALVQLSGAIKEKQLVLVSTKKNRVRSSGVSIAGSAFGAKNSIQNAFSGKRDAEMQMYHRYDISAWKHTGSLRYGVSAGYLHDVHPLPKQRFARLDPPNINRFRFHGYLDASIDATNSIWFRAGFIPGIFKSRSLVTAPDFSEDNTEMRETVFGFEAGWTTKVAQQFTNELKAAYATADSHDDVISLDKQPTFHYKEQSASRSKFNNLLLTDRIGVHVEAGNWRIDPAVDLSFRRIYRNDWRSLETTDKTVDTLLSAFETNWASHFTAFSITPSVDLSFKNIFNVHAGFVYNASENEYFSKPRRILPFISTGVDVLQAVKWESPVTWKLFGSAAAAGYLGDGIYTLNQVWLQGYNYPYGDKGFSGQYADDGLFGGDTANYAIQAGTTVSAWKGRLQGSYSYEKRKYIVKLTGVGPIDFSLLDVTSTVHRIGILLKPFDDTKLNWLTGLHASALKQQMKSTTHQSGTTVQTETGDKTLWTGGWTNRLHYKRFSAGLDLLYVFNLTRYTGYGWGNNAAISLHNIFTGYQFQLKNKSLNVFIQCRNPNQRNESMLPDRREYYGAGIKTTI